jgi:ribosomal protein L32E|tara:strand:+ start:321 stop:1511 length:1191 start_codon:yes stop_codon:yes gene_type:complete
MATVSEIAAKNNAKRAKMRSSRQSIDSIKMGAEPFFEDGESAKLGESEARSTWSKAAQWYNYFYKLKEFMPYIYQYAEEEMKLDKDQMKALKAVDDWRLCYGASTVTRLHYRGWVHTPEQYAKVEKHITDMIPLGVEKLSEKVDDVKNAPPVISIAERTRMKMMDTIYAAWDDEIVEGWSDKDYKRSLDVYALFKEHDLKGNAVAPFLRIVQQHYDEIKDALDKTCEQCVEAYQHVTPANKRRMLKQMDAIFADLEKVKLSFKANKTVRISKRKSTDVQVKNLKYKTEDREFKITSVNPVTIPGKETLFVFNTKSRILYQYVTTATAGFEIGGTSIKNFEPGLSKCTRLRKPDDVLPLILTKTLKQIESQVWKTVTTKINPCNGRINADCVLLRIL